MREGGRRERRGHLDAECVEREEEEAEKERE